MMEEGIDLSWKNLTVKVNVGGPFKRHHKTILDNGNVTS